MASESSTSTSASASPASKPIIIIGAGLIGLTLAQGLKRAGFDYRIYDRDGSLHDRPAGWGITMHWALPALKACLPPELFAKIPSIQVDPAEGAKERDHFRFLDLEIGTDRYNVQMEHYYRLNRRKLRDLLSTDIDVNWGKRYSSFDVTDDGVTVHFTDGTHVDGSMLLGVDGKNSRIKRMLLGDEKAKLNPLEIGFMGMTLHLSPEKMRPFRDIHPILWQGTHPGSGYYVFFSMLSTPEGNGSRGTDDEYYEGQFNMSWPVSRNGPTPKTGAEQLAKLKSAAVADTGFFPALRDAILGLPDDSPMMEIKLEDWPTQAWPSLGGKVTLLGDAAHTMTMYRGEAANHGMYDAVRLVHELRLWREQKKTLLQALEDYQAEVMNRTHEAVLQSRAACIEAHDFNVLNEDNPIFKVTGFISGIEEGVRPIYEIASAPKL